VAVTASTWPRRSPRCLGEQLGDEADRSHRDGQHAGQRAGPTTMMKISAQISVSTERLTTIVRPRSA